jgi:general secretion pathway protein K
MRSESGFTLVLVLLVTALLTALVIEFSYAVYVSLSSLDNWKAAQRLSAVARSGIAFARKTMLDNPDLVRTYSGAGVIDFPVDKIIAGFEGASVIRVEDENAKFNLNSLRWPSGDLNGDSLKQMKELLRVLNLRQELADAVAHHLVKNIVPPGPRDVVSKDAYLDSVDELLAVKGIDRQGFQSLAPYVTVYGVDINGRHDPGSWLININTASIPVIMSLGVTRDRAEKIVADRRLKPFRDRAKVPIDDPRSLSRTTVASAVYRIISTADEGGIRRIIECVVDTGTGEMKYWREQ